MRESNMGELNRRARMIHKANVEAGWWPEEPTMETLATKIALIHSEVSEMLEGVRKGLMDDHLPERTMAEVEAVDIFIRLFDFCGHMGFDLDEAMAEKLEYNARRADHKLKNREADGGKKF